MYLFIYILEQNRIEMEPNIAYFVTVAFIHNNQYHKLDQILNEKATEYNDILLFCGG